MARTFNLHKGITLTPDAWPAKAQGNQGLRHELYFGQWNSDRRDDLIKEEWVRTTVGNKTKTEKKAVDPLRAWMGTAPLSCGDPALLCEYARRREMRIAPPAGAVFEARLTSALSVGGGRPHPQDGGGLAWHPNLGVPYLAGSGLKQVAREWAEVWSGEDPSNETLGRVFGEPPGKAGRAGGVIFLDGLPTEQIKLGIDIVNNHFCPYYDQTVAEAESADVPIAPGDWFTPKPATFPVVEPKPVFQFALHSRAPRAHGAADDLELARRWLAEGLEILGAGAKTGTAGLGRFRPPA